jgi:hypothetical protein
MSWRRTAAKRKIKDMSFILVGYLYSFAFVSSQMSEGAAFLEVEPSESLAARFSTLWYTNNMEKKWK